MTFEEVVQLLEEVCVADKENLMISYIVDSVDENKSSYDGYFPLVNNVISWVIKEQISVTWSFDGAYYTSAGSSGKQLLWMKQILKKYNVGQDIMTFVWDIFTKSLDVNQFEELRRALGICICKSL